MQALDITAFTPAIDRKVASKSTLKEKISYLQGIQAVLALPAFKTHSEARIFANLEDYIKNFMNALEHENGVTPPTPAPPSLRVARNNTDVLSSDGKSYLVVENVDVQKVRNTLLSRHNEERQTKKLSAYTYHSNLEKSAQIWARVLNEEARTSNTHARKPGDGYYNYNSIMEWMEEIGNSFSTLGNGNPAFTESVGRGYYNCTR
ncbi:MAG: CAP domain-containing protein [Candidatus Peribacteria bacterium]|nr:CAP domain-containing protein [Candidatus Peribacteria bacterium]